MSAMKNHLAGAVDEILDTLESLSVGCSGSRAIFEATDGSGGRVLATGQWPENLLEITRSMGDVVVATQGAHVLLVVPIPYPVDRYVHGLVIENALLTAADVDPTDFPLDAAERYAMRNLA